MSQFRSDSSTISLEDKYTKHTGHIFLNGSQALVRLPLLQRERDLRAGLNTAGFISGYRGSPLGGFDQALWQARKHLENHKIVFQPGVNEDLAATSVWGTQQVNLYPGAQYDGVFAMWYGKGPGVDRSGDVLRHANAAGTFRHGGVLVLAGDDHAAKSSTLPHQTDHIFKAVMMPVLSPSNVQEYLDYGLHGWALSRYSGCWVAFKALADTVEASASVEADPDRVRIIIPEDFELPPDGLNIRWPDPPLAQERRLLNYKLYAALAYCRSNRLNRILIDSPRARFGIITSGKSYLDVRQALDDLGIDDDLAAAIGIRLYKIGMVWPLEAEGVREFAQGLEEILVVEEKRQLLEYQLKEELYNWREDVRPRVIGKFDEKGEWARLTGADGTVHHGEFLLPASGELNPAIIARVISGRIARFYTSERIKTRLAFLQEKEKVLAKPAIPIARVPYYCPGCPHNTSTKVPSGSRAMAGIGCHYMVLWMDRNTSTFSQMGGEGAAWIGQAPFTSEQHVFANLGDGTYFHSGLLAIRAAVAAKVNITYKILYNDAVAMTGGQPVDGPLSVPRIAFQVAAEGVERIVVVTDGTERNYDDRDLPRGVRIHHRKDLDFIQKQLREHPGVSALIYDQTCAAEKRRRRKRGTYPDPATKIFINETVCEGCGDCGVQSNCLAIVPVETVFGRKRAIDQSSCNKDFSCIEGFCPSFVSVEGGSVRKGAALSAAAQFANLPMPALASTVHPFNILITGVGGTGITTLGALIGMAAHIDGKGVSVADMAGLAQKGGAVFSHVRICDRHEALFAVRIAAGEADTILGGDVVVSASAETLTRMSPTRTHAIVSCTETPTAEFTRDPDWKFPLAAMQDAIEEACGAAQCDFLDIHALSTALMGSAITANTFLLGFAWQKGLIPLSEQALMRAIELNNVTVEANKSAFTWGRRAAHFPAELQDFLAPQNTRPAPQNLATLVAQRSAFLADYQNAAYAQRYANLIERIQQAEASFGSSTLTEQVARYYFKVLAYKDEYEVARLHSSADFSAKLRAQFEGDFKLRFHLAPPLFSRIDPHTGRPIKSSYGGWMLHVFRILAKLKRLRGSMLDIFGYSQDRKLDRRILLEYEQDMQKICSELTRNRLQTAIQIAGLPEHIRGYGFIRKQHYEETSKQRTLLWHRWQEHA